MASLVVLCIVIGVFIGILVILAAFSCIILGSKADDEMDEIFRKGK